jgi:hypothetical protein
VDVHFGNTTARLIAAVMSGLSLVGVLAVGWFGPKRIFNAGTQGGRDAEGDKRSLVMLGVVVMGIFGGYVLVLEPMGWLRYESRNFMAEPAEHQVIENFGEQIALIGYDVPETLRPGEEMDVTLYWRAWQPLSINYQVFVHLLAEDGFLPVQSDKLNPGDFPTRRWPMDKYVRDEHSLTIPADLAPGMYRLSVGLWVAAEGWRLPLLNDDRTQIGDNFVIREYLVEVE